MAPDTHNPVPRFAQVRLELTNRCGYRCFCCPREKMTRPLGRMTAADLDLVADRLAFMGDAEFQLHLHGHGEPLLLPDAPEMIARAKELLPGAHTHIITTLGVARDDAYFERLVESLDSVEISFYGYTPAAYRAVHGVDRYELAQHNLACFADIARERKPELAITLKVSGNWDDHTDAPQTVADREAFADFARRLGITRLQSTPLHNYGGGRTYTRERFTYPCSVAWGGRRRILQVTWDLNVFPCCFMFDADVVWGNLRTESLDEIYTGLRYRRFRRDMLRGELAPYPACRLCLGDVNGTPDERREAQAMLGPIPDQPQPVTVGDIPHAQGAAARWQAVCRRFRRVALFGAGKHTARLLRTISAMELDLPTVIVDDAPATEQILGIPLLRPETLAVDDFDVIVPSTDTFLPQFRTRIRDVWGPGVTVIDLYEPSRLESSEEPRPCHAAPLEAMALTAQDGSLGAGPCTRT